MSKTTDKKKKKKKGSKIQKNKKIEKSLQMAQKRGTKILQVPNPANPLKSSNGEKAIQKAGFVLLRLRALEAENHGLNLVIHKLTSSKQLVCKIKEEIYH